MTYLPDHQRCDIKNCIWHGQQREPYGAHSRTAHRIRDADGALHWVTWVDFSKAAKWRRGRCQKHGCRRPIFENKPFCGEHYHERLKLADRDS